jgi:hypothetical protein
VRAIGSTVVTVTVDTRVDLVGDVAVVRTLVGGAGRVVCVGASTSGQRLGRRVSSSGGVVSAYMAAVTVDARVGGIGDVAVVGTVVGGLSRIVVGARVLVTVVGGESVLDLVNDVRHDDGR